MSKNIQETPDDSNYVPFWSFKSTRFWIAFILMFLVFCAVNMRTNIGISMVCMVNSTAYTSKAYDNGTAVITKPKNPACQRVGNDSEKIEDLGYHGTFLWNPEMQGVLISSTAYGSIITILFAGYIADSYGPRLVCLIALILYAIVTLLSPFLASLNYVVFLIARSIMGLAEGCVWPCAAALIVKWFPKTERSTVAAIYTSGNQLGASVGSFVSAKLCLLTFLGGWPLIFYIYGILGIACIILWYLFATNRPEDNKFIGPNELLYLQKTVDSLNEAETKKKKKLSELPWRRMFTSPVTWAVIITRFAFVWKITVMQMLLPSYFRDVLNLNLTDNGLYTALPFLSQLISKNVSAILADNWRRSGKIGMTASTKLMEAIGCYGCAICLICMIIFVDCTVPALALVFLILFGLFAGGMVAGAFTASLCIAPDLSGTIEAAAGFLAVASIIFAPLTAGFITQTGSRDEWNIVFGITAFMIVFAGTFFLIFGSADIQPWSKFSNASMHPPKIHPITTNEPKKVQEMENRV